MDGNKAVASALLLYYHLAREGCFCGDETVYIDSELFEGFRFLDVAVEDGYKPEINEDLLREAAIIYILCDLNDEVVEQEEYFLSSKITSQCIAAYKDGRFSAIPEVGTIFSDILSINSESEFNFEKFSNTLSKVHSKYVSSVFKGERYGNV
jgi:hypothetical protein